MKPGNKLRESVFDNSIKDNIVVIAVNAYRMIRAILCGKGEKVNLAVALCNDRHDGGIALADAFIKVFDTDDNTRKFFQNNLLPMTPDVR